MRDEILRCAQNDKYWGRSRDAISEELRGGAVAISRLQRLAIGVGAGLFHLGPVAVTGSRWLRHAHGNDVLQCLIDAHLEFEHLRLGYDQEEAPP